MADYGIKITKDGYDVSTATLAQQTFNSEKNSLKIASEGSTTSTASGQRTVTIAHGLSVVPGCLVFFQVSSNGKWYPGFTTEDASSYLVSVEPYTDSTNLNLRIDNANPGTTTVKVYYYIFVDPGQ